MLVEEKMKTNNFLVVVTDLEFLDLNVNSSIHFLFPVLGYSVGFPKTFSFAEIKVPHSYLYINRILENESIETLKKKLMSCSNENIVGICFSDLGVYQIVKELGLNFQLFYMQNHSTTNVHSINYYLEYVDSVLVSTDITREEIDAILHHASKPLIVPFFALVDAMYSRRKLLSNFQEEFELEKKCEEVLHESISQNEFRAIENEYGTILYANKYIDYRNIIHPNILYYYINPLGLDKKTLLKVIQGEEILEICDSGFLDRKTYYRLKEGEGWKK